MSFIKHIKQTENLIISNVSVNGIIIIRIFNHIKYEEKLATVFMTFKFNVKTYFYSIKYETAQF